MATVPLHATPSTTALQAALAEGATSVSGLFERPLLAQVVDVCQCELGRFPEEGWVAGDDMTANVLVPLRWRGTPLTAVISFEPEVAFALLRRAAAADGRPLDHYRQLGAGLVHKLVGPWLDEIELVPESASLVEDSAAAALLGTHAPADTALVCTRLILADEDEAWGGVFYLLADPKPLATMTAAAA